MKNFKTVVCDCCGNIKSEEEVILGTETLFDEYMFICEDCLNGLCAHEFGGQEEEEEKMDIKMDVKDRDLLIEMAQDFIKYGYSYEIYISYDYAKNAIDKYGEDELKKCWKVAQK